MVAIALISITLKSMAANTTKTAKQYTVYTGTGTDSVVVVNGDEIKDAKFAKGQLVKVGPYELKDNTTGEVYEKGDVFYTTPKATNKKKYFYAQEGYTLTVDESTGEITLNAKAGDTMLPSYAWAGCMLIGSMLLFFGIRRRKVLN